jgi:hypothetical protein
MFAPARLSAFAMVLTCALGAPVGASAHPSMFGATLTAPPSAALAFVVRVAANPVPSYSPGGKALAVLLLLAAIFVSAWFAAGRRGRPPIRIIGLSLVLIATGFEAAIHSVHHLGDAAAAERCLVAATGQHVAAVDVDGPRVTDPLLQVSEAAPPARPSLARTVWLAPDAGRGPPA